MHAITLFTLLTSLLAVPAFADIVTVLGGTDSVSLLSLPGGLQNCATSFVSQAFISVTDCEGGDLTSFASVAAGGGTFQFDVSGDDRGDDGHLDD